MHLFLLANRVILCALVLHLNRCQLLLLDDLSSRQGFPRSRPPTYSGRKLQIRTQYGSLAYQPGYGKRVHQRRRSFRSLHTFSRLHADGELSAEVGCRSWCAESMPLLLHRLCLFVSFRSEFAVAQKGCCASLAQMNLAGSLLAASASFE